MFNFLKGLKGYFSKGAYLGLGLAVILLNAGCARTNETTRTETTTSYPSAITSDGQDNTGAVETRETTATTQTEDERPGVIGSVVHAIGYVIAIPFIIVGGFLKMLFGG